MMRSYHRKTLIKKEGWPLVDGWYWCPQSVVDKRIKNERKVLKENSRLSALPFQLLGWERDQKRLEARLAHACWDGKIRAASGYGVEYYHGDNGKTEIYGKCRFCEEPLSDGIKLIIRMEHEL